MRRFLAFVLCGLVLLTVEGYAAPQPKAAWVRGARRRLAKSSKWNSKRQYTQINGSACIETEPSDFKAPKDNIWSGLTNWEAASVTKWLFEQTELNLTRSNDAGDWDNSILLVELMVPNKTDVLPYIDGNATASPRYAHVVLDLRTTDEPTYNDILVGPLPVVNGTTSWQPLEYPYTRKTGGSIRNLDADSTAIESDWLHKIGASVADITFDLWGGTATGADNDTLDIWGIDPLWQYDGKITRWDSVRRAHASFLCARSEDSNQMRSSGTTQQMTLMPRHCCHWACSSSLTLPAEIHQSGSWKAGFATTSTTLLRKHFAPLTGPATSPSWVRTSKATGREVTRLDLSCQWTLYRLLNLLLRQGRGTLSINKRSTWNG